MNTVPVNALESTEEPGKTIDTIGVTRATRLILLLVMFGGLFDVFEQGAIGVVGPSLQAAWGLTPTQIGLLSTATLGSMVLGGLLGGALGDSYGRKTIFTFNLAIYSLGGLLCAFAPGFEVLMVGRVIVGLGLGGELSIALTLLAELTPTKFRASAVSLFNVGAAGFGNPLAFGFGLLFISVLAPFLGGDDNSWRWFFGFLALPALLVLWIRRNLPETPRYLLAKGRVEDANRSLSVLASGRLNPRNLTVVDYLPIGTHASLGVKKTRLSDVFRGRLLRNTITVGLAAWMSFGAQLAVLTLLPTVLVARGYDITSSLTFTMLMYVGGLFGTIVASIVNYRLKRRVVVIPAAILACIFAVLFGIGSNIAQILVFGAVFQFFVFLLNTTIWAWSPELYPTRVRAFGSSVVVNLGLAAGAVMAPIAGAVFNSYGLIPLFSLLAAMYLVLAVLALFAPETHGRNLEELHGEI